MCYTSFQSVMIKRAISLFVFLLFVLLSKGSSIDSIYIEKYNKYVYYNSDTLFSNYAHNGFIVVIDDLYEYYEDILWNLTDSQKKEEIAKMKMISKRNKSKELECEAEFLAVLILPDKSQSQFKKKIDALQSIIDKASKNDNISLKLRVMESIFDLYWKSMKYARAFRQLRLIDKLLFNVTDEEYPDKGGLYFRMGEAYFFFKDYDKAVPYLRKAMKPSKYYYDRSNILARNTLGSYYNLKGNIDSAEYYFRSAFGNTDIVKNKSLYDAISLGNLGHSLVLRKEYNKATPYFKASLNRILVDKEYRLASDITVGLVQCYLEEDNMKEAKQMIDSSLVYIELSQNTDMKRFLYPLLCEYYTKMGNKKAAKAYLDSVTVSYKQYVEKYNSLYILRAEQELFDAETLAKDEEMQYREESYTQRLFFGVGIICFITVLLLIMIFLYQRNKKAYQALVQKNQDWAETSPVFESFSNGHIIEDISSLEEDTSEPDVEDVQLIQQVHELIKKDKIFKDLDLSLDSLSKQINVNRNYLSKAINRTTGKNFNTYINEYRIKEAIKIMSDAKSDFISLDAIALEVGFSNRTTFYQAFKKVTGLTPSDFRNNKTKYTAL